jgi:serine/threonine protein kinase/tetratricopeptide (TPR) repeat protein
MSEPTLSERSVFEAAVEKGTPGERAAFLDQVCAGNEGLRREVEALLSAHDRLGPVPPAATRDESAGERPGGMVGSYKLLEQIGEGGFGMVFLAEQTQPVRRKVALKVLKPGMDTGQVVARFEAERQALALMDHPHIARVLDAGQTASGRPYFVMELVKGLPITEFCDQGHLTPRERLELFADVCRAVQHAHQKGIIHRDIKPSNVLVALHDGVPVPKVIDFGIAKALGQQLTDKTLFTGFAQMIGTPLYMSPEQAALSNVDVDTRSDVYSLGVMLYELLTGTTPFTLERLQQAGYDEMRRIIREEEPPRPSTRLSTLGQAATTVSTQRKSDPKRLRQLCRGELDWIVMKALEKDRNRRYESASAFAADVQRYLNDEPVLACPPSVGYRLRKLVRRHKALLAVSALVLFFLVVLGGTVGWTVRNQSVRRELAVAEAKKTLNDVDELRRQGKWTVALGMVRQTNTLLAGAGADAELRRQLAELERDLEMAATLEEIRLGLSDGKEGFFDWQWALAEYAKAFERYGIDVETLEPTEAAKRIRTRSIPEELSAALADWANLRMARDPKGQKRLLSVIRAIDPDSRSQRLYEALAARQGKVLEELAANTQDLPPSALSMLAQGLIGDNAREKGESLLRQAQRLYPDDLWINYTLAASLRTGKPSRRTEAVACYRAALALRPRSVGIRFNLATTLCALGKREEGMAEYRRVIELREDFAEAHNNLGNEFQSMGRLPEAVAHYRKALQYRPNFTTAHNNLGVALQHMGKLSEAEAEYRRAIGLRPNVALAHLNLGRVLRERGNLPEAVKEYRRAIALDRDSADAHRHLGAALYEMGKHADGVRAFQRAIQLDPDHAEAHYALGIAWHDRGRLEDAIAEYRAAIRSRDNYPQAHYNLGIALSRMGDLPGATAAYRKTIALAPEHAKAHCNLGLVLQRQGELRQALKELRRGHELGSRDPSWPFPSRSWVRRCERMVELEGRLPGFLERKITPASAQERLELAALCFLKRLYRAAARFYEEAFTVEPARANDLAASHRYLAACAAALAGCGKSKDPDPLDDSQRAGLRRQALVWLRADLKAWSRLLDKQPHEPRTAARVREVLQRWQAEGNLDGVREAEALARLPEAERKLWQELWADVASTLAQAQGKKPQRRSNARAWLRRERDRSGENAAPA